MASQPQDPPTSSLIFPAAANNLSQTLSDLKRSTLSLHNRLKSIAADSRFVLAVADAYGRPLIANERCGSWYIPPARKAGSCYFKSTDGHAGEWAFSLRRLNTQVLDVVGRGDGCIIVDSTRRGKSMPDALSKTVPIWCAVLNRVLFPADSTIHDLRTPPQAVSASEHSQMRARLDGFVQRLQELGLDTGQLAAKISKPLRPIWVTQDSDLPTSAPTLLNFHPVICCTASRRVSGSEASEGGYIQGAGDDSEGWALGLTPVLYREHAEELLSEPETSLPSLLASIRSRTPDDLVQSNMLTLIPPTVNLHLSALSAVSPRRQFSFPYLITSSPDALVPENKSHIHLSLQPGKNGSRQLRIILPMILDHLAFPLTSHTLIAAASPTDHGIGIALAILVLYYDDAGNARHSRPATVDKSLIRRHLSWLTMAMPRANPSRATLLAVNSFLMERPD